MLTTTTITEADIMGLVKRYVEFPFPQICRHLVALELLSLLESKGHKLDTKMVAAVCNADADDDDDETALKLIQI